MSYSLMPKLGTILAMNTLAYVCVCKGKRGKRRGSRAGGYARILANLTNLKE
jgi:hypothetical protein